MTSLEKFSGHFNSNTKTFICLIQVLKIGDNNFHSNKPQTVMPDMQLQKYLSVNVNV